MSIEYNRLLGLIKQTRQERAPGIIHKADDEPTYLAAKIQAGAPVDIRRFITFAEAKRHAMFRD